MQLESSIIAGIFVAGSLLASTGVAGQENNFSPIRIGDTVPGGKFVIKSEPEEFGNINLTLGLADGKTGKKIKPEKLTSGVYNCGDGLRLSQSFSVRNNLVYWKLNILNQGKDQRWLHLKINAAPDKKAETWFFDGVKLIDPCRVNTICKDENLALPLAVIGRKKSGFAWGINPKTMLLSYVEQGADFSGKPKFWFGTKLVINPNKTETLDLVLFGFRARFGYLDAIQIYHNAFPEIFAVKRPGLNIDPKITLGGCDYRVWKANQPEEARRFGGGWEWCLKSHTHCGDYLGKHWNVARKNGVKKWYNSCTAEKHQQWIHQQHLKHQQGEPADVAMMFYITQALTDAPLSTGSYKIPLAKQVWPDAYAGRAGYQFCYPWGDNNYARNVLCDLTEVAGKLSIRGFAFDTARSPLKFFGKGTDDAPGRAYLLAPKVKTKKRYAILEDGSKVAVKDDQHGVYSRLDLASSMFIKFIHEMRKGEYNLGVVTNGCDWMEGFHTDSLLIEHTPNLHKDRVWVARLIAGQKVMSWWDDFRLYTLIDWENQTRSELRGSVAAFSRFVRLKSLVLAGIPMYRIAAGNEILFDIIPTLVELTQAGWQAVPAMSADKNLWTARYGKDLDTYLVLCNPKGRTIKSDVMVEGSYFSSEPDQKQVKWLFRDYAGMKVTGEVGNKNIVSVSIPSAREQILKTGLRLDNPSDALQYTSGMTNNLNSMKINYQFSSAEAQILKLKAEQPDGYFLGNVAVNGKAIPFSRDNEFVADVNNKTTLSLAYNSLYFASPDKDFIDFEFVKDLKPAATIVIPAQPTKEEQFLAFRFQEYFRYYYDKAKGVSIKLPILKSNAIPTSGQVILIGRSASQQTEFAPWKSPVRVRIGVKGRILYVAAIECFDAEMRNGVYRLFHCLDRKYKYFGKMGERKYEHPHEEQLYRKAGLIKSVLYSKDGE